MNKLLKSQVVGLQETKNQQGKTFDETCSVHICISNESKKNWKSNQNRRPKVVYRGLYVCVRRALTFKFDKNSTNL